jgi:RNA polymerase sigma-70 factor (ECF subfamily)
MPRNGHPTAEAIPHGIDMAGMEDKDPAQATPNDRDAAVWPALMRRAQEGDQAAYRRLLIAITPYLRAVVSRVSRDPNGIEDTVQDILMTLHSVRHTYDPDRPFKPWLAGIARYRLLDRMRGQRKIAAREIELTLEHETFAAVEPNTESGAWDKETIATAMQALPHGQRQAIELLKLRELSLKEAAIVSGMSIAALKVATHRGLKALRRLLAGGESA